MITFLWKTVLLLPPSPMPLAPPHSAVVFVLLAASAAFSRTCSSKPARSPCPPFPLSPPYPFSSTLGRGHPSFHIHCSSPYSLITINDLPFAILSSQPNSSTLLLSPQPHANDTVSSNPRCSLSGSFNSVPGRPINFSGSPFRVSEASCSRLSVLTSCSPSSRPNCSGCPWQCELVKSPIQLLQNCGSVRPPVTEQGCQEDVLEYLNNFLKFGIEVSWDEGRDSYFSNCKDCLAEKGVCGFNSSDPNKRFVCLHSETRISPAWIGHHRPNRITLLSCVFAFSCLLFFAVGAMIFRSRRKKSSRSGQDPTSLFLQRHRSANLLPPVFTYEELEISTNRFDTRRKIGDGGFGAVYLGHLPDGRVVAVKHLHRHQTSAAAAGKSFFTKSFCNEILILSSIGHPNLVKLHGYCSDPRGLLLVYDYVSDGTLADHLHGPRSSDRKESLTWQARVEIALQTALAMEYLHFSVQPAIVHRDITSANIFIEKDMRIKVGDFGLSRLLVLPDSDSSPSSADYIWTGPQGTPGYLDPDYHHSFRLTEKSDVYSFGVVLMELISGLKPVDQNRDKQEVGLADLVVSRIQMGLLRQVVDPALIVDGERADGVDAVAELAFRCVAADKDDRPDSRELGAELRRIRARTRVNRTSDSHERGTEVTSFSNV